MKYSGLFFLLLLMRMSAVAQDFENLDKIKLKSDSDFIRNEKTILDCVDFLSINRLDQAYQNRTRCNNFIWSYGNKTPFVTVGIESYVTKLMKKNTDLLYLYMGYWLQAAIKDKSKETAFYESYAVKQLYKYVKSGNSVELTKMIQSLLDAGDKDQLAEWLSAQKK
jgi:hypothetical protein